MEPTNYPKQPNWNQNGNQNEPRNFQSHPCGTGSQKVFKKGAKRRKPEVPKTSTSDFYGFGWPPIVKMLPPSYRRKTNSFLMSFFRKQIDKKGDPGMPR